MLTVFLSLELLKAQIPPVPPGWNQELGGGAQESVVLMISSDGTSASKFGG